ncbi:MAG: hypothetical protein ACUVQY_02610 [Thermoproteota archaeon]
MPYFKVEFDDGTTEFVSSAHWQDMNSLTRVSILHLLIINSTMFECRIMMHGFTMHDHPRAGIFEIGPHTIIFLVSAEEQPEKSLPSFHMSIILV